MPCLDRFTVVESTFFNIPKGTALLSKVPFTGSTVDPQAQKQSVLNWEELKQIECNFPILASFVLYSTLPPLETQDYQFLLS